MNVRPLAVRGENRAPATVRDLIRRYADNRLVDGSDETVKRYHMILNQWERLLGRTAFLDDLTDENINEFLRWLLSHGRKSATANKARSVLCALWGFASKSGWINVWPAVRRLREPKRMPVAWTPEQLRILFQALAAQEGYIRNVPARIWWLALHGVLLDTGERIGAIRQLLWSDFRLDQGILVVRAELRKGRSADMLNRLHPQTVGWLREFPDPKDPGPFGSMVQDGARYSCDIFWRYKKILTAAGLPVVCRQSGFHRMRRTVATALTVAGHDATRALGHSDSKITACHYIDPSQVSTVAPCDVLARPY
jgi:integrase